MPGRRVLLSEWSTKMFVSKVTAEMHTGRVERERDDMQQLFISYLVNIQKQKVQSRPMSK